MKLTCVSLGWYREWLRLILAKQNIIEYNHEDI